MTQTDKTTPTLERIVEAVMNVLKDSSIDDMSKAVFETNIHSDIASVLDEKVTDKEIDSFARRLEIHIETTDECLENFGLPKYVQEIVQGDLKMHEEALAALRAVRDRCARPEWVKVENRSLMNFYKAIHDRIQFFNDNHHTYEGSQLQDALNTIIRLVPPSQFLANLIPIKTAPPVK